MNAVSIVRVVLWLCPHLETKAEQQLSVVLGITFCIGFVSSDCSKMNQGRNSVWYIILHILGVCVAYTEHSNSYCKMHTLSSKPKEELLSASLCKIQGWLHLFKKQTRTPTRSLWSSKNIAGDVVLSAKVTLPEQSALFFWPQNLTMLQFPEGLCVRRSELFSDHQPELFSRPVHSCLCPCLSVFNRFTGYF